tara:strand:- start:105060 stop:105248 length:189 start_codon:yes stop_codon:yes gene_type:complete
MPVIDQSSLDGAVTDIEDLLGCAIGSMTFFQALAVCKRNNEALGVLESHGISIEELTEYLNP